ncbi:MAG: fibronectin type III domain-containing protein [Thermoplasmata archaeon]
MTADPPASAVRPLPCEPGVTKSDKGTTKFPGLRYAGGRERGVRPPAARLPERGWHTEGGRRRHLLPAVLAVAVALLGLPLLAGNWGPAPHEPHGSASVKIPAIATFLVTGEVYAYSSSNITSATVPVSGDTVSAVPTLCPPYVSNANACPPSAAGVTDGSGGYSLNLSDGSYYVYSAPRGAFGGDSETLTVAGASVAAPPLDAFFELSYTNTTYVLPDFNPVSAYVYDHSGTQVPVLSYTSDGTYYINGSDDLVYYSFPNRTVTLISPWEMLYDKIGYLGELNNYLYLTLDGAYAYEVGCTTAGCGLTSHDPLVEYAVNVTTGRSFTWDTGIWAANTSTNANANMVGRNGNDSLMTLVTSNGALWLHNPWNNTTWRAGTLPYFEANNLYWVPFLNSYINIQADGATTDEIEQVELEGFGSGTSFRPVFGPAVNGPGGVTSNGVNGLVFNLTLNEMAYDYGASAGNVQTVYVLSNGVLSHMVSYSFERGAPYGAVVSDDHRLSVTTGAPVVNGFYDPDFYNQSWVSNPFSQQYYDTNVEEGYPNPSEPREFDSVAGFDGEAAHEFLNASSGITAYSVNCANATAKAIDCPLLGTSPNTTVGTVYYVSDVADGSFPYPASAPLAQTAPPGPLTVRESNTTSSVTLGWARPSLYPILNFTVYWGFDANTLTQQANLSSDASGYTILGLTPGLRVYYGVTVTDLNGVSRLTVGSTTTSDTGPAAPTGLQVVGVGVESVDLTWSNPPGTTGNDTLYEGAHPRGPFIQLSEGVTGQTTATGLQTGTMYFFQVAAWNVTGESAVSNEVTATTLGPLAAPTDLTARVETNSTISLAWTNPSAALLNDTVYYATGALGPFGGVSVGVATTAAVVDLAAGTTYYFGVTAWDAWGQSPMSNEVDALTLPLVSIPGAAQNLTATAVNSTAVLLTWTPPGGTVLNYTAGVGTSESNYTLRSDVPSGFVSSDLIGDLSPATDYHFTVWAWGSGGEGKPALAVNATTLPSTGAPGGPTFGAGGVTVLVGIAGFVAATAVLFAVVTRLGKRLR